MFYRFYHSRFYFMGKITACTSNKVPGRNSNSDDGNKNYSNKNNISCNKIFSCINDKIGAPASYSDECFGFADHLINPPYCARYSTDNLRYFSHRRHYSIYCARYSTDNLRYFFHRRHYSIYFAQ